MIALVITLIALFPTPALVYGSITLRRDCERADAAVRVRARSPLEVSRAMWSRGRERGLGLY